MGNTEYSNINVAKPLLNVAKIFGQYPYCNLSEQYKKSTIQTCYGIFLVVVLFSAYCYTIMRIIEVNTFEQPTAILDIISKTSKMLLCVTSVSENTILNGKRLHDMTLNLKQVDGLLKLPTNRKYAIFYSIKIVMILILGAVYYTLLLFSWNTENNFVKISSNGLEMLLIAFAFIINWLICYYIQAIKFRFKTLNNSISDSIVLLGKTKKVIDVPVRLWIETYTILTAVLDDFNDSFGAQLFYIFINALLGVLMPINSLILLTSSQTKPDEQNGFGIDFTYMLFVVVLFPIFTGIYVAKLADHAYQEAKWTGFLTYKILQWTPNSKSWATMRVYRDDLIFLAKETSFRCPQFSAAGFFPVDYSMLFILLTSVTTYLVVLIQFNKY